jgi:hypothetical protein
MDLLPHMKQVVQACEYLPSSSTPSVQDWLFALNEFKQAKEPQTPPTPVVLESRPDPETPSRALSASEVDEFRLSTFEVSQIPLPPTPSAALPLPEVQATEPPMPPLPPAPYTEAQMADKLLVAKGPEEWSPALQASLRTLRPTGSNTNRRQRCRLTNSQGQTIRVTIPKDTVL